MGRIIAGIFLITLGLSAILGGDFFKVAFSLILIFIGVMILTKKGRRFGGSFEKRSSGEDYLNEVAIFSPINKVIQSDNFSGGKVVAVFGGREIDLSEVKTRGASLEMEIVAVFGGLKLTVPKDWKIKTNGVAIIGGYDNRATGGAGSVTLNLKGVAIFGGVEIVN